MGDGKESSSIRLHELANFNLQNTCDRSFNFNWTLQALKKQLYHSCKKQVVSA